MSFPQKCPYCKKDIAENPKKATPPVKIKNFYYRAELHSCFHCEMPIFVYRECLTEFFEDVTFVVQHFPYEPPTPAMSLPDHVPKVIRTSYEEAYKVIDISPNASAILSRRCLESVLKDVHQTESWKFEKAIKEVEEKVDPVTLGILDKIRGLGNAGAHAADDFDDTAEITEPIARQLLSAVDFILHEWYVVPKEKTALLDRLSLCQATIDAKRKGE